MEQNGHSEQGLSELNPDETDDVVRFSKVFWPLENPISDQLKRDFFVEGSAASKLVQRWRGSSITVMEYLGVNGDSVIENKFAEGVEKSNLKVFWSAGDDGVVGGVPAMKGLQLVHVVL